MKTTIAVLLSSLLLVGCAPTYTWVKTGSANNNYYQASSYCQALSTGATPMDYSNSGTSTTFHSGTVYGANGSSGTYSGTSTTYNNNMGQAFANLGQSVRRQQIFNDCMRGQGFTPQSELREAVERKYSRIPEEISEWDEYQIGISEGSISDSYDEIPLKAKPAHRSSVTRVLRSGDKVQVLGGAEDSWIKVSYEGQQGYLAKKWVTPSNGRDWPEPPTNNIRGTEGDSHEKPFPFEEAKVTQNGVPMRFKPNSASASLQVLEKGETVEVLSAVGDTWLKVRYGLQTGYIRKEDVSPLKPTRSARDE